MAACSSSSAPPPGATSLRLAGPSSSVTAGIVTNVTVTAQDPSGHVVSGYTRTVHFPSTALPALLPSDYPVPAADPAVRLFPPTSPPPPPPPATPPHLAPLPAT